MPNALDTPWTQRAADKIDETLRYYMGPAYAPVNALANVGALFSPGGDMMDMAQSSNALMQSKGGWDTVSALGDLGTATLGMAIPGRPKQMTEAAKRAFSDREREFMKYMGSRTFKDEADARRLLTHFAGKWAEPPAWHLDGKPNPFPEDFVGSIPLVRDGKGMKIGVAGKGSSGRAPFEAAPGPIGQAPRAAWGATDMQDYRKTAGPGETVDEMYVSLDSLPQAKLAGGKTDYNWTELERFGDRDSIPPVTVKQNKNGSVSIIDGNHRIEWFRQQGFDSVPAYVIRPKDRP